ncbi:hypothetical protein BDDG_12146 [Blastomyces dermatitidis ATCC 18188]|uniref:Uncharacterized protein n=1 Tax=Ajellomyces dermatitidis (strain ATCC 18188 / CBS 674.68) TaxID=653446 RepID=A0A0J9HEI3_AJEDA|nr:hypothetical protein BDDG_12146 [Blastomyces dermatitidis ATCC 18188]
MAPCDTLIVVDTSDCVPDRGTSPHLLDSNIFTSIPDTGQLPSSPPIPSPSSRSTLKKLPARAESTLFVFATTTLTITATTSPSGLLSSHPRSSYTPASFTPTSTITSSTLSRSTPSTSAPESSKQAVTATSSRPPEATGSVVVASERSSSKEVPLPILALLIILAIAAVMLSLAICRVRKSSKFCRQCREAIVSQTLTKQTPPAHDHGTFTLSGAANQSRLTERIRGSMGSSALNLNGQLAQPHIRDEPRGIRQWTTVEESNSRPLDFPIATMAPRIPQLSWERPKPDPMSLYARASASGREEQRGRSSISVASIIDEYAQFPNDNRYLDTFQVVGNNGVPGNPQNLTADENFLVDLRNGSLRRRTRDDYPSQPSGEDDTTRCAIRSPTEPYTQIRERQEGQLGITKVGGTAPVSRHEQSPTSQYKESSTQTSRQVHQDRQTESSYSPTSSSCASQPSSMTSWASPWPVKTGNVSDRLTPNFVARPSMSSHTPADATQDSDDNISTMLNRWALLDRQNLGLVDQVPLRSYSARDKLNDHLNNKRRLKLHVSNVRRSMSTTLPEILSRLPSSGANRAGKNENAELYAPKNCRNKLVEEDPNIGSTHIETCTAIDEHLEPPNAEFDDVDSRDHVFGRPSLQQRTYSESIYSRPTTLHRLPEDTQAGDEQWGGQGYPRLRRYAKQSYGSPEAGPSQSTPAPPFRNEAGDRDSPTGYENNLYGEQGSREQGAPTKNDQFGKLSLGEPGTIRDDSLRWHTRNMIAPRDPVKGNDAGGPADPEPRSFINYRGSFPEISQSLFWIRPPGIAALSSPSPHPSHHRLPVFNHLTVPDRSPARKAASSILSSLRDGHVSTRYNQNYKCDIFDEEKKKKFIIFLAKMARGRSPKGPKDTYILLLWKQFTAEWARRKEKLPSPVTSSGSMFIAQELHLHAAINRDISARDFVTLNHFRNLIQQLWKNDWPRHPMQEDSHRLGRDSGLTGEILTATWADKGLAKLGRRAGYEKLISVHDMRAEGLVRTNENGHSMEELMQMAGHGGNPRIFFEHYMSSTSSVQGVSNILKLERRKDIAEPFRGLTLRRHPQLWQALPAKLQQDHLYNPCR